MPFSLRPMLLTAARALPVGDGWVHEAKLDGWRCLVEVSGGRVQVWSRRGGEYTAKLPELQSLSRLDDVVLDGELVVVTEDGRADFELLSRRLNNGNRRLTAEHSVTLYVRSTSEQLRPRLFAEPVSVDRPWCDCGPAGLGHRAQIDAAESVANVGSTTSS